MVAPELIEYVRNQLAASAPREVIQQALIENNWAAQDIEEAFILATPKIQTVIQPALPQPSYLGTKLLLSVGIVAASAGYVLWQYLGGQQPAAAITPITTATTQNTPIQIVSISVPTPPVVATSSQPVIPSVQKPSVPVSQPVAPVVTKIPTPVPVPVPTPQPVKPAGLYADGSYTGNTVNAYYGLVQVEAVVQNGQLADVKFLQYPSDRSTSRYINSQAMPMLTQEAIQAQNANVDIVSGATFTSQAFQQSLASALTQAKN